MKFRILASAILVIVLLCLYGAFQKGGDESSSAPASVQSTDDNQFKGLGK